MKKIGPIFLLVGLLGSVGYWFFTSFISGDQITEVVFVDNNYGSIFTSKSGVSVTTSNSGERSHTVALSPKMNPIRLVINADYLKHPNARRTSNEKHSKFGMDFLKNGDLIWSQNFSISKSKPSSDEQKKDRVVVNRTAQFHQVLKVLNIKESSDFTFRIKPKSRQELQIVRLALEVRANVVEAQLEFYLLGGFIFFLGLVLTHFGYRNVVEEE